MNRRGVKKAAQNVVLAAQPNENSFEEISTLSKDKKKGRGKKTIKVTQNDEDNENAAQNAVVATQANEYSVEEISTLLKDEKRGRGKRAMKVPQNDEDNENMESPFFNINKAENEPGKHVSFVGEEEQENGDIAVTKTNRKRAANSQKEPQANGDAAATKVSKVRGKKALVAQDTEAHGNENVIPMKKVRRKKNDMQENVDVNIVKAIAIEVPDEPKDIIAMKTIRKGGKKAAQAIKPIEQHDDEVSVKSKKGRGAHPKTPTDANENSKAVSKATTRNKGMIKDKAENIEEEASTKKTIVSKKNITKRVPNKKNLTKEVEKVEQISKPEDTESIKDSIKEENEATVVKEKKYKTTKIEKQNLEIDVKLKENEIKTKKPRTNKKTTNNVVQENTVAQKGKYVV